MPPRQTRPTRRIRPSPYTPVEPDWAADGRALGDPKAWCRPGFRLPHFRFAASTRAAVDALYHEALAALAPGAVVPLVLSMEDMFAYLSSHESPWLNCVTYRTEVAVGTATGAEWRAVIRCAHRDVGYPAGESVAELLHHAVVAAHDAHSPITGGVVHLFPAVLPRVDYETAERLAQGLLDDWAAAVDLPELADNAAAHHVLRTLAEAGAADLCRTV